MHSSDGKSESLLEVADLREYFRGGLGEALQAQELRLDDHCEYYVVNLLSEFAHSKSFYEDRKDYYGLAPLAVMLREAEDAPNSEARSERLQRLGDVALFVAGCFSESLDEAVVGLDYYLSMGGGAYSSLSSEARGSVRHELFASVFAELAEKFAEVVDALNVFFDSERRKVQHDLQALYRRFQSTGSLHARSILSDNNVICLQAPGRFSH